MSKCGRSTRRPAPASGLATARLALEAKRPHTPAGVVAVQRQVRHRFADLPVLAEPVVFRPFRAFRLGRSVLAARRRTCSRQNWRKTRLTPPRSHPPTRRPTAAPPRRPARSSGAYALSRRPRRPAPALGHAPGPARLPLRRGRLTERAPDRRLVHRVLVAGHQLRQFAPEPPLDLGDDRAAVLLRPRPGDHRQDQPVLGVVGDVVPIVPAGVVGGVAVLCFLFTKDQF
jgi:hypothetical protein